MRLIKQMSSLREYIRFVSSLEGGYLTSKEIEVLEIFVSLQMKLGQDRYVFTKKMKDQVATRLGIVNLNGYIKKLKDKGILDKNKNGYYIRNLFIPSSVQHLTIEVRYGT